MTRSPADLSALLGKSICHDLSSPLGAIANGVELLTMTGGTGPEIELISESVASANARIRFFRVAFGAASKGQSIGAADIRATLQMISAGSKTRVDWLAEGDVPRPEAKLVFLLLMCMETAMPWGGAVTVVRNGSAWTVRGTAERMRADQTIWDILAQPESGAALQASEVQFLLLPQLLEAAGRSLTLEIGPGEIVAQF